MKLARFFTLYAVSNLCCPLLSHADVFKLNNNQQIEGKVITESATEWVVRVTPNHGDPKQIRINKKEVIEHLKTAEDESAYRELGLAQIADYDHAISPEFASDRIEKIDAFLKKFPKSNYKPVLEESKKLLSQDLTKLQQGQLKHQGKWLQGLDAERQRYALAAKYAYDQVSNTIASGNKIAALRQWDHFSKNFPSSQHFPAASKATIQLLQSYVTLLEKELVKAESRKTTREKHLATLSGSDRVLAERNYQSSEAAHLQSIDKQKRQQFRWLTPNPYDPESYRQALTLAKQVLGTLRSQSPEKTRAAEVEIETFWTLIDSKNRTDAMKQLQALASYSLPKDLLAEMNRVLDELEKEEKKEQESVKDEKATDTTKPSEATPNPPTISPQDSTKAQI